MGVLRLLLAVSVLLVHTGGWFGLQPLGAAEAVQTFYMISGFYMALVLTEKYRGPGAYRRFLGNRFLRIYPVYWTVAGLSIAAWAVCYALTGQGGPLAARVYVDLPGRIVLGISNALIFGQDAAMFCVLGGGGRLHFGSRFWLSDPQVNAFLLAPQAWSLGVELLFYLVAPLLARRRTRTLLALMVASLALRGFVYFGLGWNFDPWTYRCFPLELAFFLAGMLAYRRCAGSPSRPSCAERCSRRGLLCVAVLFLLGCLLYQFVPGWKAHGVPLKQWLFYATAWWAIPRLFLLSKDSPIDRGLGELSYPLYLVQFLPLWFLPPLLSHAGAAWAATPAVLMASLLMAAGLVRWVASPLERLRRQPAAPAAGRPLVALAAQAPA